MFAVCLSIYIFSGTCAQNSVVLYVNREMGEKILPKIGFKHSFFVLFCFNFVSINRYKYVEMWVFCKSRTRTVQFFSILVPVLI